VVVWVRATSGAAPGPWMGARFVEFIEGEDDLQSLLEAAGPP
jgi:hypothetical protein